MILVRLLILNSLIINIIYTTWQERVYEYVCELCHDNGKRVPLLLSVENEELHETTISPDLEVCVTMNASQKNGKLCILLYFL